jgi:HD-GYP domain-containing protein (c-di-GMP phosphodiesterase class II)
VDEKLAIAQSLKYAEELQQLYVREREQRTKVEQVAAQLADSYATTVRALATALELRDDGTGAHAERVTTLALLLAAEVAPELTADPELEYGFLLHDLGKIGVPDAILLKPGPLTRREMEEMRYHPILGEKIVAGIPYLNGVARQVVAAHHVRWDGGGYPRGLAGPRIPLSARIFAVADAFDAMTNDRPYRKALTLQISVSEIVQGAGTQFDPALVDAFVELAPALSREAA